MTTTLTNPVTNGAAPVRKRLSPLAPAQGRFLTGAAPHGAPRTDYWHDPAFAPHLAAAGMDTPAGLLAAVSDDVRRAVGDRVTRRLELPGPDGAPRGFFLKTHREPAGEISGGRLEADAARTLWRLGVPTMRPAAFAEVVDPDGAVRSGLLTDELAGYEQLDLLLPERFPTSPQRDPAVRELVRRTAAIARRFHRLGFTHRDFYTCHFLVKEVGERPGTRWDVRLIDLHRVERRAGGRPGSKRWRWLVKDFAQLLYSIPPTLPCRERAAFLRAYRGGRIDAGGRRLLTAAKRKEAWMRWKLGPYRPGW